MSGLEGQRGSDTGGGLEGLEGRGAPPSIWGAGVTWVAFLTSESQFPPL